MKRHSIEELKAVLDYDPETGWFSWKIHTKGHARKIYPGDRAGTDTKEGRRQIGFQGTIYREHVLAWAFMTGEWPPSGVDVEHRNEDGTCNRWNNLRLASRTQNNWNRSKTRSDNVSGHSGVSWRKGRKPGTGKWHARINVNRKPILLGDFDLLSDAISARRAAEERYFGEFAPDRSLT